MVGKGATTIWELWNGDTADPAMNSGNHVMLVGDLAIWFYEDLGGIKTDPSKPAFKHIIMRPQPVKDLRFVRASHLSPYGRIASEWRQQEGSFDWEVEIPANTTATVYVPARQGDDVAESGKALKPGRGIESVRFEGDRALVEVGAGSYHFRSQRP
jgi:alpha-L-rhamnosidase